MLFSRVYKKRVSSIHISVTGTGISFGRVGEQCKFAVSCRGSDRMLANHCSVAFEGPSKPEINFLTHSEGVVECIWIPKMAGVYKVFVRYNNDEVPGSPFLCRVEGGQNLHATHLSNIRCKGRSLQFGTVNVYNEVLIEGADSMIGGISVSMEGPTKPEIQFRNEERGLFVLYKCMFPGMYTLNIKFTNDHVNGSPFNIRVQ